MNFDFLLRHKPCETRKIASAANELVKALASLRLKKYRLETGLFLAEGARTLIEALDLSSTPLAIAYSATSGEEPHIRRIRAAVQKEGGFLLEVNDKILRKVSTRDNPQTVVGVFRQEWAPLARLDVKSRKPILVLEEVRDPGNLGTILRTADGFGANAVVLVGETADPYGLEAVRASMGSVFAVSLYRCAVGDFLKRAASFKGEIIGTALQGAADIAKAKWARPLMLLMGNEQKGLSDGLKECCTQLVKIPMSGRADSFNLAVAAGIALYCCCAGKNPAPLARE